MNTQQRAEGLLELLALEQIEQNLFRGRNEARGVLPLFGGQVLAQACRAAMQTVEALKLHSLHAYFLRAGSADRPVLYDVERVRDGRSFATRRVVAVQAGEAIFIMDASFQIAEPGLEHAHPMPNVPLPHELEDDVVIAQGMADPPPRLLKVRPFHVRSVFPPDSAALSQERYFNPRWIRFPDPPDDDSLQRCLLTYASDMGLVATVHLPHQSEVNRDAMQMASLDHAMWIHREVDLDGWLLFHTRTSVAGGSRGLVHAEFFTEAGELVASVTQEGLVRKRD